VPTSKLIEGHEKFHSAYESDHEVFDRLADEGQNPKVMWVGCSDSRVIPELITGAEPGELFIFRDIANVVPPAGSRACGAGAAVEYAVMHLGVAHIVICGHTECGGIASLAADPAPETEPHITSWLDLARPAREQVIGAGVAEPEQYLETIKTNVVMQLDNLRSYPCVVAGEEAGTLRLHGWLYDLHTGTIDAWEPKTGNWSPIAHHAPAEE
jgi:carbonic anhydrase